MTLADNRSLQQDFAPRGLCFGCGPANSKGLRIRSFPVTDDPETLVCEWTPEAHHAAYGSFVNGGVIGSIFDCHCNWTATWHLMHRDRLEAPPCTVTANFQVKFKRPTPIDSALRLLARVVSSDGPKATVEATLTASDKVTATCHGLFVAVKPSHPAYHRW